MPVLFKEKLTFIGKTPSKFEMTGLIISNLITISLLIITKENILFVLWVYWFQSIFIGLFLCLKILFTPHFRTESSDNLDANNLAGKIGLIVILLVVIFFFHAIYAVFLGLVLPLIFNTISLKIKLILLAATAFAIHYLFNFIKEIQEKKEHELTPTQGSFLLLFFKQIFPLHLTIIVAVFIFVTAKFFNQETYASLLAIVFFQIIKTLVDISAIKSKNLLK